jgi:voltage-gated potassium channel
LTRYSANWQKVESLKAAEHDIIGDINFRYLVILLVFVLLAFVLSTVLVKEIIPQIDYNDAAYFVITVLFDVVGIDISRVVYSYAITSGIRFDILLPVLIADGLIKIVVIGFALAGVVEFISSINIRDKIIKFRIRHYRRMVIVCGYGGLGEKICDALASRRIEFVVLDKDTNKREIFISKGYDYVFGDFTDKKALEEAGCAKANTIIFTISDDFENTIGIMAVRGLNSQIRVISSGENEQAKDNMGYVGADFCVIPEVTTGDRIGNALLGQ